MPTALIVEDEPEANKLLGMLIKLRGYRSASAFNGREAMEQMDRQAPDVLFLDLMLPDVDGYQICRALKSSPSTCLVPLVIVSARIAQKNREDSFHAGADEFVAKPYTPDQIFEALKRAEGLREQASRDRIRGLARFTGPDDGAAIRELARLRCLILGRTPLDPESAGRINALIERAEAVVSGRAGEEPPPAASTPASIEYELSPERIVLTFEGIDRLEDLAGSPDDPMLAALADFDEVLNDPDAGRLTLIKRWA